MRSAWLHYTLIRAASLLAPGELRKAWVNEWRSELWYVPRREATLFCLGAFRDALWLRSNSPRSITPTGTLQSPLGCLAWLATLAALSLLITISLPTPRDLTQNPHLNAADLLAGCITMLLLFLPILATTKLTIGRSGGRSEPAPWLGRLRSGIFLALKIALLQPLMYCSFAAASATSMVPIAPTVGLWILWGAACRWVLTDQRRRCPVCLSLLTGSVRIGTPARTFLEWYGAESMCSRGHGLLHAPETSDSYSGKRRWLKLDPSWTGLFSAATKERL